MASILVAAIQFPIRDGSVEVNVDQVVQRLTTAARDGVRLAVLPDLWTTGGATIRSRRDSELSLGAIDEVRRIADRYGIVVVGSAIACARGLYYDEAHVIDADGSLVGHYRRVHRVGADASAFAGGRETPTFQTSVARLGVLAADDLLFPEQGVALALGRVRIVTAPVAWEGPDVREGQMLASARAIENQVFVVAANRARDPFEAEPRGGSIVLDPEGQALAVGGEKDELVIAEIDVDQAYAQRSRRQLLRSRVPEAYGTAGAQGDEPAPWTGRILERGEMADEAERLRADGRSLVFTNGCFDILHVGHVRYLERARSLGDALVVGLNSDRSVRALQKGPERPVQTEADRAEILAALGCVDYVVIFDEDTPLDLITAVQPDVLVKGGDWTPETVVGREIVEARGGRVEIIGYVEGRSTTNVIARARKSSDA